MRRFLLSFFLLGVMLTNAQVGINTEDPRALLDIKAANEVVSTNTPGVMVVGDGLLIPRVSSLLVDTDFPIEGVIVYLTSSFTDTAPDPDVTYAPGFYVSYNSAWETLGTNGGSAGLEEITEGGNTGYRRADAVAANYGDIGENAVDLSNSDVASTTLGATGASSFSAGQDNTSSNSFASSLGRGNIASGFASTAIGDNNSASGTTSFISGENSTASGNYSIAMGQNVNASGVNSISMGLNSISSGNSSTAMGDNTVASGGISTAIGFRATASGFGSTAMGDNTTASGSFSTAMGNRTIAANDSETALGKYNIEDTQNDNLFVVGNGEDNGGTITRSDAFLVNEDGTITAPSLSIGEIDTAGDKSITTREFTDENYVARLPSGNTASRPTGASAPAFGTMRYNTQTGRAEVYVQNSTDLPEGSTYVPGWVRL